jgi:hypothetical protein
MAERAALTAASTSAGQAWGVVPRISSVLADIQ